MFSLNYIKENYTKIRKIIFSYLYLLCYNEIEIKNLKLNQFYFYYSLYITFYMKKGESLYEI